MKQSTTDIVEITRIFQLWGFGRDQGRWQDLADTFTEDGHISVTWFHGPFRDFIAASRRMFQPHSPRTKHLIGSPVVDVRGERAVAETNIQILGRFRIGDVDVDNTSYARFLDRLVRTGVGWRIQDRVAIYEKDRLDPVRPEPGFSRFMSETDFSAVPEPYRYLGYRLLSSGRSLHDAIVCDGAPEALVLQEAAQDWLAQG